MRNKLLLASSPGRVIIGALLCTIALGTLGLYTTWAQKNPVCFFDCLFTATSATCVTGLLTVPISSFTTAGHAVIMCLIQLGGLGVVTLMVFLLSLFVNLGLETQHVAGQSLELDGWKNSKKLMLFIIITTLIVEGIGTIAFFNYFKTTNTVPQAWFLSLFHSISLFCNAGFSLFPGGMAYWRTEPYVLIVASLLVFIGELGFITLNDIMLYIKSLPKKRHYVLSLHSRLAVQTSCIIVIFTTVAFYILESQRAFAGLTTSTSLLNALFDAISSRSTGDLTIAIPHMNVAALFLVMIVGFIGSSPGSTGSGIKTTTFAIFLATMRGVVMGKTSVEIKNRRIANDQVFKAMAILSLALCWLAILIFLLLMLTPGLSFIEIVFEAVSSFTNLGLSFGTTPLFSYAGKILLVTSMILGRIGSLTLLLALRRTHEKPLYTYPEERVILS